MRFVGCWLYAINRYGYPPSLEQTFGVLEEYADMGFRLVELEGVGGDNLLAIHRERHRLRAAAEGLGLRVVNFCPILADLVSPEDARRRSAIDLYRLGVEIAVDLGCDLIQTDSFAPGLDYGGERPYGDTVAFDRSFPGRLPPGFSWAARWEGIVSGMRACAAFAEQAGLRFCLEPRVGESVSNTDALLRLMDRVGPGLDAVLDCGHLHAQKENLALSAAKLAGRIAYVHASDNDGKTNLHLAPGRGTIDWPGLWQALDGTGFDGYVGVDVGGVADLREQMLEGMRFLESLGVDA